MIAISILLIGLGNLSMVDGWYGSGGDIHEGSYWSDGKVKKGLLWERIEVGWQMTYEYSPKELSIIHLFDNFFNDSFLPIFLMNFLFLISNSFSIIYFNSNFLIPLVLALNLVRINLFQKL